MADQSEEGFTFAVPKPLKPSTQGTKQNPLTSRATVMDMSNRQNGASTPKPQAVAISEPRLKPDQRPGKIPLEKGYSQMDWMRLTRTHPDLAGLGGQSNMRQIPLSEVKKHRSKNDTWLVLRGKVYNVTPYLKFHPGGLEWIMKGAGLDATSLFNKYHAWVNADFMLEKCLVGYLAADTSKPPVQQ